MNTFVRRNPSFADISAIGSHNGLFPALRRWIEARRQASARDAADRQLWNAAMADPRIMAEIQRAESELSGERRKAWFMRAF